MSYVYVNPESKGMKKVKISRKDHNRIFTNWKLAPVDTAEYYMDDTTLVIQRFTAPWAIILNCLLFPVAVLFHGIANYKEIVEEHKRMLNQKKYGAFVSETCYVNRGTHYKQVECLLKGWECTEV